MGKVSNSKDEHACRQEQKKKKERGGESTVKKKGPEKVVVGLTRLKGAPSFPNTHFFLRQPRRNTRLHLCNRREVLCSKEIYFILSRKNNPPPLLSGWRRGNEGCEIFFF